MIVWRACFSANASVLTTRSLSLNGSDHRPRIGFDDVNSLMVATNAGESLMGRVVAFCIEKSWRHGFALPSGASSTEKDNDRTSGLKSEFMLASAFANSTTAEYTPGF